MSSSEGNVGLAFGLTIAAGLCTTVGAAIVFCARLANAKFLAGSLGFSAGVMLYVSFAEIFLRKSVGAFEDASYSEVEAYRYSTLAFFGGFLVIFLLDQLVHFIIHMVAKRKMPEVGVGVDGGVDRTTSSTSRAVLLEQEENASSTQLPQMAPSSPGLAVDRDEMMEAGTSQPPKPMVMSDRDPDDNDSDDLNGSDGSESNLSIEDEPSRPDGVTDGANGRKKKKKRKHDEERSSRQSPDVMTLITSDPHSIALHKMGLLTALAIFIHNFPEGLATYVATMSDTSVGLGIAVAIAVHNIPEGICVALPIYYSTGSKAKAFIWATLSGISEPLGALVGYFALSGDNSLAFALVFALVAGMMVYIAVKELLPMALRYDPTDSVSTNFCILGMVVMAASLLLFTL
jgi:ZIP family zinc transporter